MMDRMQIRALEQWGWLTPNEARKMRGLPAIPGGDVVDIDHIYRMSDVAVFPGPLVCKQREPLRFYVGPFSYGMVFLLLLWACMAWEKWIGWVM